MFLHNHKPYKTLVFLTSFIAIVVINFLLISMYARHLQVQASQQKLLSELEHLDDIDAKTHKETPLVMGIMESDIKLQDGRSAALKRYLRKIDSPLFDYADLLVEEADKYGYDYKLLVAIGLQESTGCKFAPENSFNCWGWGIYGDKITRFSSYEEAIKTVSSGIKKNYIDKGYITTEDIMSKYTPSSDGSWAWGVRFFFNKIENQ
jgi:hypothetical protein